MCKRQENHDSSKVHEKEQGEREQRKKFLHVALLRKHKVMFENSCRFDLGKKFQMYKYASHSTNTSEDH